MQRNLLKLTVAGVLLAVLAGCAIVPAYGPYADPGVVIVPSPTYYGSYPPPPRYYGYRGRWDRR